MNLRLFFAHIKRVLSFLIEGKSEVWKKKVKSNLVQQYQKFELHVVKARITKQPQWSPLCQTQNPASRITVFTWNCFVLRDFEEWGRTDGMCVKTLLPAVIVGQLSGSISDQILLICTISNIFISTMRNSFDTWGRPQSRPVVITIFTQKKVRPSQNFKIKRQSLPAGTVGWPSGSLMTSVLYVLYLNSLYVMWV